VIIVKVECNGPVPVAAVVAEPARSA
jgi:hypothetical protein